MPDGNYEALKYLTKNLYYQRKWKWYEKIWYFITRKKNEMKPLGTVFIEIKGEEDCENND